MALCARPPHRQFGSASAAPRAAEIAAQPGCGIRHGLLPIARGPILQRMGDGGGIRRMVASEEIRRTIGRKTSKDPCRGLIAKCHAAQCSRSIGPSSEREAAMLQPTVTR